MYTIRPSRFDERPIIFRIINAAAAVYEGAIPADCWHDPYMSLSELDSEMSAGVTFWVCENENQVIGVMGIQSVRDVDLIRHAYVTPEYQRRGVGAALIRYIQSLGTRQILVGTWAAATWAIDFYRRHGFEPVSTRQKSALLKSYWTVPQRQIDSSVVLANPALAFGVGGTARDQP